MAAPHVSGVLALGLSVLGATLDDVETCAIETAVNISAENPGFAGKLGHGLIDAWGVVDCVSSVTNHQPTPMPTFSYCNVMLVDGGGTVGPDSSHRCPNNPDEGRDDVMTANVTTDVGGVRCCSDSGNYASFCSEDCEMVSFDDAATRCAENAMRLCTEDEMMAGLLAGTGCFYDHTFAWTASPCGTT